jgi:excisionase family DNA binding protein
VRERYIDTRELAVLMGVSTRTVERMVREGMPSETWGLRRRRFLASEAMAWARERAAIVNGDPARGAVTPPSLNIRRE